MSLGGEGEGSFSGVGGGEGEGSFSQMCVPSVVAVAREGVVPSRVYVPFGGVVCGHGLRLVDFAVSPPGGGRGGGCSQD